MVTASLLNGLPIDLLFTMNNMETIENKHVAIETKFSVECEFEIGCAFVICKQIEKYQGSWVHQLYMNLGDRVEKDLQLLLKTQQRFSMVYS